MEALVVLVAFLLPIGMRWLTVTGKGRSEETNVLVVFGYMVACIALFWAATLTTIGPTVFFVFLGTTIAIVTFGKLTDLGD